MSVPRLIDDLVLAARELYPGRWLAVWTYDTTCINASTTCSAPSAKELFEHLSRHHDLHHSFLIVRPMVADDSFEEHHRP